MNPLIESLNKTFSEERLSRLTSVKIGIGGAGGLGSNAAMHLVRSGCQNLTIIDFDRIEPSNLNRQFYFADQVGQFKVEALADNLKRINPDLQLNIGIEKITKKNVESLFADCDVWIEAFDSAETKKLFVEAAFKQGKYIVSASGLAGWGNSDALATHQINTKFVMIGDLESEVSKHKPPMSPRVGIAAAKEADTVLTWILGREA
ncbi:thiamine biosynthesis protein ThiF, family 2 [Desulfosporosinus acidiphilus SJ4]|uniref:Thiamine biosynthesis protein ThiF, family 2 n=1 Tax=Desulfosporosinus acidiphilus (strain DSM 22704 / JCM 16185 / SJ4) TaxID=646529 RepID=I4D6L1_DESAJ|nr:sulfur carrier protein ThiS adenylyltransferase ThiF [Desulfosporosinus acidiphilus]AFM41435.1 thiamine biosynthesis protein ThiF, family 2 [Desulfosporosinus acidiphilus SJ4]